MADSLIRLRQLNKPEVSGYILDVVNSEESEFTGCCETGFLTGEFYPRKSNPSGYLTNSGNFLTTGSTGNFVDYGYLASNTTSILNTVSGIYYPLSNPSGFITGLSTGSFITINQTGNFVTTGQTGSLGNSNTGVLTGAFYPRFLNPSGYITTGQTGNFGVGATGLLTGSFYPRFSNPSGYITSGLVVQSSGYLQNQIEDLRLTGAFLTTGAGDARYIRSGLSIKSNTNVVLYDSIAGWEGLKFAQDDEYYLRSVQKGAYIDVNGVTFAPVVVPTIYGFIVSGGAVSATGTLTLNGKDVLTTTDSGNLLSRASGDALYYSIANPDNFATKSYVGVNFASLAGAALINDINHNTKFYLADSIYEIQPLSFIEGSAFVIFDSGGNQVLDIYGGLNTGASTLTIKQIFNSYQEVDELYADNIYLGGVPIKSAISGVAATGSFVSMLDDNHNVRLTLYDTGSLSNRFVLGSGRNDEFYLQYRYVHPNTSTELKSKIDLANQSIVGFNINANSVSISGTNVVLATQTGNFLDKSGFVLKDQNLIKSIDYSSGVRTLYDDGGATSLLWEPRRLFDSTEFISASWQNRELYDDTESATLNWRSKSLTGNWSAQGLTVSGQSLVTGGPFYPLNSNPAPYARITMDITTAANTNTGFILYDDAAENYGLFFKASAGGFYLQDPSNSSTKIDFPNRTINNFSGNFTTLKISGINVSTGGGSANTGELTGAFYPLKTNPSGYLTGQQLEQKIALGTSSFSGSINLPDTTGIKLYLGKPGTNAIFIDVPDVSTLRFNTNGAFDFKGGAALTGSFSRFDLQGTAAEARLYDITDSTALHMAVRRNSLPACSYLYSLQGAGTGAFVNWGDLYIGGANSNLNRVVVGRNAPSHFTSSGVGLNTNNPKYHLDVNGSGNFSSGLFVSGNLVLTGNQLSCIAKTGNFTPTVSNDVIFCNSSNGTVFINLPEASGVSGKQFRIKRTNSGSFNVIVSGNYIDGETGITLPNRFSSLSVISDGSGYYTF